MVDHLFFNHYKHKMVIYLIILILVNHNLNFKNFKYLNFNLDCMIYNRKKKISLQLELMDLNLKIQYFN